MNAEFTGAQCFFSFAACFASLLLIFPRVVMRLVPDNLSAADRTAAVAISFVLHVVSFAGTCTAAVFFAAHAWRAS